MLVARTSRPAAAAAAVTRLAARRFPVAAAAAVAAAAPASTTTAAAAATAPAAAAATAATAATAVAAAAVAASRAAAVAAAAPLRSMSSSSAASPTPTPPSPATDPAAQRYPKQAGGRRPDAEEEAQLRREHAFPAHLWTQSELESIVAEDHLPAEGDRVEQLAYRAVNVMRSGFDWFSGYKFGDINDRKVLLRACFLETVAGVPGMVASSIRHLRSLRQLEHDGGWLRQLLEEAENERVHMLIFSELRQNGILFRTAILGAQLIAWNALFVAYIASPRFVHAFVHFLEAEAVKTYTGIIDAYDAGKLPRIAGTRPPPLAMEYYSLPDGATMRDVILRVRADEANHRKVNETLSHIEQTDKFPEDHAPL